MLITHCSATHTFMVSSVSLLTLLSSNSSASAKPISAPEKPRLVVIITVDQMRADLIDRFSHAFRKNSNGQDEGFLKLRADGVEFTNARTASAPTVTAAGHAALCTGTSAHKHGIIGNQIYDRAQKVDADSTFDLQAPLVVSPNTQLNDPLSKAPADGVSARNLKVPTLATALAKMSQGQSRSVSVSLKDRGAVYCAGENSVGTYWYEYKVGSMVSSSAFTKSLPVWVNEFNARLANNFSKTWTSTYSLQDMQTLLKDDALKSALTVRSLYSKRVGQGFPYTPPAAAVGARKFFELTPAASDALVDFALEAVRQERLGCASRKSTEACQPPRTPDLLTISFSSPDLVGHTFGGESPELMDIFINLNKSIERLTRALEEQHGKGQILYVISADHGVQPLPEVLQARGQKVERLMPDKVVSAVEDALRATHGEGPWIETISTAELYFNNDTLNKKKIPRETLIRTARTALLKINGIRDVLSAADLTNPDTLEKKLFARGHNPERSGDLKILTHAGWLWGNYVAANHGTAFDDDTRIPVIFSGWKIRKGHTNKKEIFADDVAPTILGLMGAAKTKHMTGRSLVNELKATPNSQTKSRK